MKHTKEMKMEAFNILWDRHLRKWYQKNEAQNDYPVDSAKYLYCIFQKEDRGVKE
jgi:hypothetical protein